MLLKKVGVIIIDINLSDEILIKDNHISASKKLRELVKKLKKQKKLLQLKLRTSINLNKFWV